MRLASVIDYKDSRLGNCRKEENDGVKERFLEFHISADFLVLLQHVFQSDMVKGIVISKYKKYNLSEETDGKPFIEDGIRGANVRDVFKGFCI